jgi:hypothetical protein
MNAMQSRDPLLVATTTRVMKDALILAAEQVGDLSGIKDLSKDGVEKGKDGLVGYLRWAAKVHPTSFLSLLGRLLPMQIKVDKATKVVYHSVEEIQRDIAQRGLNVRSFGQMLLEAHPVGSGEYATDDSDSNTNH